MRLEDIGFYTLSNERADNISSISPMWRCEMILTDRCNFKCPYCRGGNHGDMPLERAYQILEQWFDQGLRNVRFSGGEPMLYPHLGELVEFCAWNSVDRIAISTNGSHSLQRYEELITLGVNDFSISLDACCAATGDQMAGMPNAWTHVSNVIRELSKQTYVTVGVVLTDQNIDELRGIVEHAHALGVADIRIIPAAQDGNMIKGVEDIPQEVLDAHPILKYRVENILRGNPVRSIRISDTNRCAIPIDDSVVAGNYHYPCVIYMREFGDPIGKIGPNMREERIEWVQEHNTHMDPICHKNCLDIFVDHNNRCML